MITIKLEEKYQPSNSKHSGSIDVEILDTQLGRESQESGVELEILDLQLGGKQTEVIVVSNLTDEEKQAILSRLNALENFDNNLDTNKIICLKVVNYDQSLKTGTLTKFVIPEKLEGYKLKKAMAYLDIQGDNPTVLDVNYNNQSLLVGQIEIINTSGSVNGLGNELQQGNRLTIECLEAGEGAKGLDLVLTFNK
ncbi:hypothetical protein GMMP15_840002 [Candidatus Magnetomoraceae bacterium gMMP-15]